MSQLHIKKQTYLSNMQLITCTPQKQIHSLMQSFSINHPLHSLKSIINFIKQYDHLMQDTLLDIILKCNIKNIITNLIHNSTKQFNRMTLVNGYIIVHYPLHNTFPIVLNQLINRYINYIKYPLDDAILTFILELLTMMSLSAHVKMQIIHKKFLDHHMLTRMVNILLNSSCKLQYHVITILANASQVHWCGMRLKTQFGSDVLVDALAAVNYQSAVFFDRDVLSLYDSLGLSYQKCSKDAVQLLSKITVYSVNKQNRKQIMEWIHRVLHNHIRYYRELCDVILESQLLSNCIQLHHLTAYQHLHDFPIQPFYYIFSLSTDNDDNRKAKDMIINIKLFNILAKIMAEADTLKLKLLIKMVNLCISNFRVGYEIYQSKILDIIISKIMILTPDYRQLDKQMFESLLICMCNTLECLRDENIKYLNRYYNDLFFQKCLLKLIFISGITTETFTKLKNTISIFDFQ